MKRNIDNIEARIQAACKRAGRDRSEVTLIAVSKTNPLEAVHTANDCGLKVFGENRVQEMCLKMDETDRELEWHLIGHLQTNKVKYIIGRTAMIHSVDSLKLAQEIEKESAAKGVITPVLIEMNVAEEESKFGVIGDAVYELVREISELKHVSLKGLMTVAPYTEDPESNRKYFRKLKDLSVDINSKNIDNVNMSVLSMGMTGDFEVAVEEGATHIRVGTGIFGARNYEV
ncbi:MAG: YggS family pyridoxal phosphate-dependent enzyme [Lachnospiraceae bacterium]|nr:YggS family pyridoxal phosphate-dependent enzyme [Lachnospiraceae bacterium]